MAIPTIPASPAAAKPDCDYLGVRHDPQTRLGFASSWNYCHHAVPPATVNLEHQRRYCQTAEHVECPAFKKQKPGPLPADIRGKHAPLESGRRSSPLKPVLWIALMLSLLGGLAWLLGAGNWLQPGGPVEGPGLPTLSAADGAGLSASGTPILPTLQPLLPPPFDTPEPVAASDSDLPLVPTYFDPSPATRTPVSTAPGVCGHQLDQPFGPGPQFIIHQAGGGDSLNMYEITYRTSLRAIEGINDPFPIPLRKDSIVVIALDTLEVGDLPVFRPFLVSNRNTPIETMAFKVAADLLAFERYNEFDDSCRDFIGWVLAPHERAAH